VEALFLLSEFVGEKKAMWSSSCALIESDNFYEDLEEEFVAIEESIDKLKDELSQARFHS